MNKPLLFYLSCLLLLTACRGRTARGNSVKTQDTVVAVQDITADKRTDNLDTSMVSLKTFRTLSLDDALSQVWAFDDADKTHWNNIFWDSVTDTRQFPELALFPDHSAVLNPRCGIKLGKWDLDKENGEMSLQWKDGSADLFIVRQRALKQMELVWHRGGDLALVRLKSDAIVHRQAAEDPYYPSNNKWRIKPPARETRDQLRQRIKGCVHFYALFFSDNHKRQATDISFSGLPSCFEWYNGAIGMQSKSGLDKRWIACFYSEDQAYTAYDIVADELGKHNLKWPEHPTSWVKQTGEVLQQLADKF
jgi:hypothetical protein